MYIEDASSRAGDDMPSMELREASWQHRLRVMNRLVCIIAACRRVRCSLQSTGLTEEKVKMVCRLQMTKMVCRLELAGQSDCRPLRAAAGLIQSPVCRKREPNTYFRDLNPPSLHYYRLSLAGRRTDSRTAKERKTQRLKENRLASTTRLARRYVRMRNSVVAVFSGRVRITRDTCSLARNVDFDGSQTRVRKLCAITLSMVSDHNHGAVKPRTETYRVDLPSQFLLQERHDVLLIEALELTSINLIQQARCQADRTVQCHVGSSRTFPQLFSLTERALGLVVTCRHQDRPHTYVRGCI